MIIVIDNNVLLDALLERNPFYADAANFLIDCINNHTGFVTANSLTDIFYVLTKIIGAQKTKRSIQKLIGLFDIIPIGVTDCINALELPMDDFENALLVICAMNIGADYIVSRDAILLKTAPIKAILPVDFLNL